MDDFRRPPQRPPQRPVTGFGPRPQQRPQGPVTDLRPQAQQQNLSASPQRPQQPLYMPQQAPREASPMPNPMDFSPPTKKKGHFSKLNKVALVVGAAVVLVAGSFMFINSKNHAPATQSKSQQAARKAFETPTFTTYFPSPMPAGLSTAKGSIAYYKDSFTFILQQGGQNQFFVYENPASSDPGLKTIKSTLTAPKNIALTAGKGVLGSLDVRTITAVTTDKGTILRISCSKPACATTSKQILSNMQLNSNLDGLKRNN